MVGTAQLVKYFSQGIKPNWLWNFNDSVTYKTTNFASVNDSNDV